MTYLDVKDLQYAATIGTPGTVKDGNAELDLRSIKVVLGTDVRRCRTPEMVC